jgi:hypothetical protein
MLLPETNTLPFMMVIEKLKIYITPAGKIRAGGRTRHCGVHKPIYSVCTR